MSELYVEGSDNAEPVEQEHSSEEIPLPVFNPDAAVPVREQSVATRVSSVLFFTAGMIGMLLSVLLLVASLSLNLGYVKTSFFNFIPIIGTSVSGSIVALSLELLILVLAAFHFITGNWLWRSLKRGAVLGMTVALMNATIAALVLYLFPMLADASYLVIVVSAFLILAIVAGWSSLRSDAEGEVD